MISNDDLLWFVDDALDQMIAIVRGLGNELANEKPAYPQCNSPYAILNHCLGMMEGWGGACIAGREISRDRDSEFIAAGDVEEIVQRARASRVQLEKDVENINPDAPLSRPSTANAANTPYGKRQGPVFVHIFEELSQHLGQMEITRDVLVGSK